MTAPEIAEILKKHAKWLRDLKGGSRAYLSCANLSCADLSRADLSRADLSWTCLEKQPSPFDWAVSNGCDLRVCNGRILVLASRTRAQIHMHGEKYEAGKLYVAPVFSRDGMASCHPGLYIAGGRECDLEGQDRILVACWLDEMFIVGKCRVPRFRTVNTKEEFEALTTADMEPGAAGE